MTEMTLSLQIKPVIFCCCACLFALPLLRADAQTAPTPAQVSGAAAQNPAPEASPAGTAQNQLPAASTLAQSPPPPITPTAAVPARIQTPELPHGGWQRQAFTVAPCAAAPILDGRLDDACWKTATHVQGFYRLSSDASVPEQTEAWLCADARHLYVAFHCLDAHPEQIRTSETQRNGNIGHDDFVGIDIDSQNTRRGASAFQASANGTQNQDIEGGTASNTTWAGDWRAAVGRTLDGWTCEMAIPFALMRYPRGARQFGMLLYRKLARETTLTGWPYVPPQAQAGDTGSEAQYLGEFGGISPPNLAPRPVLLPYTLTSAGATTAARQGLDLKYPLTTTLTGVAALFPDFQTVEQAVTNVSFSYTEKLLDDDRPFFAESSGFLPSQTLFYSRSVGDFDGGLKVAGKTDATTVGLLGTTLRGDSHQDIGVVNIAEDIGTLSNIGFSGVTDSERGVPSNRIGSLYGNYSYHSGSATNGFGLIHDQSWLGGDRQGGLDTLAYYHNPTQGRVSYSAEYDDIGANFDSLLGYVPNLNERGYSGSASLYNQFDGGQVEHYYLEADGDAYQHHTGGFFYGGGSVFGSVSFRNGNHIGENLEVDQYTVYHDATETTSFGWNRKSLYSGGSFSLQLGREEGQRYVFYQINQGYLIARPFSLQLSYDQSDLGSTIDSQLVLTGTYRLSPDRTLGGRIVAQDGHMNLFLSYGQQARSGDDVFLLFGDPNGQDTRGEVTFKLVHPMAL